MGRERAATQGPSVDTPDGFGVAVVREEGQWRCSVLAPKSLTSLAAAETELRELRSAGAVFGLLDVDDEFFVIVRPAPSGTKLFLSDATASPGGQLTQSSWNLYVPFPSHSPPPPPPPPPPQSSTPQAPGR